MIRIAVDLFRPAFHGLRDEGELDWPPSPVRLLGALKSGAHALTDADADTQQSAHRALDLIAAADPPRIRTPLSRDLRIPDTYTERTWVPERLSSAYEERADRALSLEFFEMSSTTRDLKPQGALALSGTELSYDIDVQLTDTEIQALRAAATRVPYFGRSNDQAILRVETMDKTKTAETTETAATTSASLSDGENCAPAKSLGDHVIWHPVPSPMGRARGWTASTIEWMNINHARVFSSDPAVNVHPPLPVSAYTRPLHYTTESPRSLGDGSEFAVLPLSYPLEHHLIPWAIDTARRHVPSTWRLIPLTLSAHSHADGELVGFGIRIGEGPSVKNPSGEDPSGEDPSIEGAPSSLSEVHAALETALLKIGQRAERRSARPRRVVNPSALQPEHWIGPAALWRSTTPLRGFPDLRVIDHQLRHEVEERFGVGVKVVEAITRPEAPWHAPWSTSGYTDGYGQWWLSLEFDGPMTGPLLLGSSQEDGFGVFRPIPERRQR